MLRVDDAICIRATINPDKCPFGRFLRADVAEPLQYGVPNLTAISICESLFWDRYIAIEIAAIIYHESATSSDLDVYLLSNKDNIRAYLDTMPSYFTERFSTFINRKLGS